MTSDCRCDILIFRKNKIEKKSGDAMSRNVLNELATNKKFLTQVEGKIAEVILRSPEDFLSYSLQSLSEETGVSQGSIINFSNKFSGGGFPALKIEVAKSIKEHKGRKFSVVEKQDDAYTVLEKQVDNVKKALSNTVEANSAEVLNCVADEIISASKVEIYGIFRSAVVATDLYYQLIQCGVPSYFVSDVLTCAVSASVLDQEGLIFAVSSSGRTKDVIDAVKIAKERGIKVVCLTANMSSPLARLSDYVLIASASGANVTEEHKEVRTSQLAVIDALCSYVRSKKDENNEQRYYVLSNILNSHSVND